MTMPTAHTFADSPNSREGLARLVATLTAQLAGRPLDADLAHWLNTYHGHGSATVAALTRACETGAAEGWLCEREGGGIRYGRAVKPGPATHGFSVDVVDMADIAGPHHVHPHGEIDLLMPVAGEPRFDGSAEAWCVYPPGSAHRPTVSQGRARVLYLLPEGAIDFTRS